MELSFPAGFEPRAIADGGGRLLVLGGPKGTSPFDKPPRRILSVALDGSDARIVAEDSFGDMLASAGGFMAWSSAHAVGLRAIEGDEPIAPADAKMTCAPAVGDGICVFVGRPADGGSPVARLDARTGRIQILCTIESEVGGLAVAGDRAFFVEPAARAIHAVSLSGGAPEVVVRGEEHVGPIAGAGDTVLAVVDRAVLALPAAGGAPHAICSAHDTFRQAKKIVAARDAAFVVTRAHAVMRTDAEDFAIGAALHRVAREGHAVEARLALAPPPGTDFLAMLRGDTLDDVAVVGGEVFVLTRSRGVATVTRLPRPATLPPPPPAFVDPVRDAYEAHLGPRDPLEPELRRLSALGWTGAIVQGRTPARLRYTATSGLRRGKGAYEVALLHRRREAWALELVASLAEIELTRLAPGQVLDLLARHAGVTAGPFPIGRREVGVLLVDGPPLLPFRVDVDGEGVRLLRALVLTRGELRFAAERGVAALIGTLVEALAVSVSDPRRRSIVDENGLYGPGG